MTFSAGFIGLGNQGKPIAEQLVSAGLSTTVYDISQEVVQALVDAGASAASSPREVGAAADIIGVCVPEDHHVKTVALGDDGLLAGMSAGNLLLVHSTILPETIDELSAAAETRGVTVLDACVTGGAARAANRQLTYLVGGSDEAFAQAVPYFTATSDIEPIHAGELGSGAKLKLCVNLITYIQWAAAYESMILARASGLSQEVLEKAGRSNGQMTDMMAAYLLTHKAPEEARATPDFQKLMTNHMNIAEKDLAWALQLARKSGVALPVGSLVSQSMARLYGVTDDQRR
jgi:3-hydroxyisobutyrate dehydrogenase